MKDRKRLALYLSSLAVLCAGFVIIRYALLSVHGMRECPLFLFIGGLSLLFISFFAGARKLPLFIALSYIIGFAAGLIFQSDGLDPGGGKTNDLWIIWTVVYICIVIVAAFCEGIIMRKKKER